MRSCCRTFDATLDRASEIFFSCTQLLHLSRSALAPLAPAVRCVLLRRQRLPRQHLYFCTSKARKLSTCAHHARGLPLLVYAAFSF
jgi:hypothetical protein